VQGFAVSNYFCSGYFESIDENLPVITALAKLGFVESDYRDLDEWVALPGVEITVDQVIEAFLRAKPGLTRNASSKVIAQREGK
jgi:hypothetical protein